MKTKTLLAIAFVGALAAVTARADFFDNFDTYTVGSLNGQGGWTVNAGALNITAADSASAPNSVVWGSSASSRAYHQVSAGGTGIFARNLDWSFDFKDVGATRDFNCIYGYSGHAWGSGLTSVLALGDYNSVSGKYEGRYSAITGATYADGALSDGGTLGWFSLGNGGGNGVEKAKTQGWHLFEVRGSPDGVGKAKFQFFIDNDLVGTVGNLGDYELNFACIGGAVSVGVTGGNTDNYSVQVVPEPTSIGLCLLGGLALTACRILRRRV